MGFFENLTREVVCLCSPTETLHPLPPEEGSLVSPVIAGSQLSTAARLTYRVQMINSIIDIHRSTTAWRNKDFHKYPQFYFILRCGHCHRLLLTTNAHKINDLPQRRLDDEIMCLRPCQLLNWKGKKNVLECASWNTFFKGICIWFKANLA
jgi:hypothetical protein